MREILAFRGKRDREVSMYDLAVKPTLKFAVLDDYRENDDNAVSRKGKGRGRGKGGHPASTLIRVEGTSDGG